MVSIVCKTPEHIEELWPIVFEHLSLLLKSSRMYSVLLVERAVVSIMRICLILAVKPSQLRDQIYLSFDLLGGLPPVVANSVAEQIISGLILIVQNHREVISSQTEWNIVLALVRSSISNLEAARTSFDFIQRLIVEGSERCISADNMAGLVAVLDDFASAAGIVAEVEQQHARRRPQSDSTSSSVIDRGRKAVDLMFEILKYISSLTENRSEFRDKSRHQLSLPVLVSLSRQSTSASSEVRHSALSSLSRAILGPLVAVSRADVVDVFQRVLYPLLEALIDAPGNIETTESRLRASVLLCKAFMRFEVSDNVMGEDVTECWMQVLDYLGRLIRVDQSEQLSEAVNESLKNAILVMHAAGLLFPPLGEEHGDLQNEAQLWHITHDKIEQFIPGFIEGIVPLSQPVPSSVELSTTSTPAAEKLELPPPNDIQPQTAAEPIEGTSIA